MSAEEAQNIAAATAAAEAAAAEVSDAAADAAEDDDIPTLEAAEVPQAGKQSKRYAKRMAKLGLKPEPNVTKVNIRKSGSLSFSIAHPEIYRFPGTKTFVIFGEAQLEDMGALAQEAAARATVGAASSDAAAAMMTAAAAAAGEGADAAAAAANGGANAAAAATTSKVEEVADDDDADIDAGDLAEKEINVVMSQAGVSRAKAIRSLKNNNGDIVNAIMELTM